MRILVSGSSGLIGSAVVEALEREGHAVARLVRPPSNLRASALPHTGPPANHVRWDPVSGELDAAAAGDADAVVHLAGESIAQGRWNASRKRLLRNSRIDATRGLVNALAKLPRPPRVFISASAIGYYGDRGEEELTEQSTLGNDFLAALARDWEAEAAHAGEFGARAVQLRFGVVLTPRGGALARMLPPFRLGVGGRLGSGRQWMSWLTLAEAVAIVRYALENAAVRGPVNAVAPNPVRNAEFTAVLGRVLRRPTIFPVPAIFLRLAVGELADVALLTSQRVLPKKLQELGYRFLHADLVAALSAVLTRKP